MLIEHQHPHNKSIMVAVLGAPNVGKSSLINHLLGMDLSAVTARPQTTRNRFHCVLTIDRTEIVLVDTPGVHRSNKEFNKRINQQARDGVEGADLNLLLLDITENLEQQLQNFVEIFEQSLGPTWIVFTKSDLVDVQAADQSARIEGALTLARQLFPQSTKHFVISSAKGENIHLLTGALCDTAQSGPHLYEGEVSNKSERFFATEYIREQAFEMLKDELPYELAVVIDEYKDIRERGKQGPLTCHISATILVNRPSQRAIVIGSKGGMIKQIGTQARKKIEAMVGGQVHLNLHVKVAPHWFKNNFILEELGLPRAKDSARVWRAKS